jgi:hypothetical protein
MKKNKWVLPQLTILLITSTLGTTPSGGEDAWDEAGS